MTIVIGCNLEESKIFCFGGITKRGGGLAACRFKANQQAGLVERKVGSISDVRNWGQGWVGEHLSKGRLPHSPTPGTSGARAFIDRSERGDYMQKQHSQL